VSDERNAPPPIDLRSLADVDAPEIVGPALRRFRRRILVRFIWTIVVLAASIAIVAYLLQVIRSPLDRIDGSGDAQIQVQTVGGAQVLLYRATYIDGKVGLHFILVDDQALPDACLTLSVSLPVGRAGVVDHSGGCGGPVGEARYLLRRPSSGRIRFRLYVNSIGGQLPGSPLTPKHTYGTFVLIVPPEGGGLIRLGRP
jgi:hypothetical protein